MKIVRMICDRCARQIDGRFSRIMSKEADVDGGDVGGLEDFGIDLCRECLTAVMDNVLREAAAKRNLKESDDGTPGDEGSAADDATFKPTIDKRVRISAKRQETIKKLVFEGKTDAQIAAEMNIQESYIRRCVEEMQYRAQYEEEQREAAEKAQPEKRRTASGMTFLGGAT